MLKTAVIARNLHRWLGLVVGLQVLIWLVSGLYMVVVDIDFIHGDPMVKNMQQTVAVPDVPMVGMGTLRETYPAATDISLQPVMGKTFYTVTTDTNRFLIDPETGGIRSPLNREAARAIAKFHFEGDAPIVNASLITSNPPMEIQSRRLPLWRIDFDDRFSTSFYIDPYSGVLVTRRHQYWRIFDFMWMMHIMDYEERADAHNLLLILAQISGLIFASSGLCLLYFQLWQPAQKQNHRPMKVTLKKLHKWVGLLIGIQVLLWLTSGLMISLLDPEKVNGRQWAHPARQASQTLPAGALLEPDGLPAGQLAGALRVDLTLSRGKPVYRIQRAQNLTLLSAVDGTILITSEAEARYLAQQDFTGDGKIVSVEAGTAPDRETRNSVGEYWRVNFSDNANTSIYISASTGEILERRNNFWRVRDFFWMLHIMDYPGRENLNNNLVIIVSLIAVWLGISGFILLFGSFNRHDFYFLNLAGKRNLVSVTLIDPALGKPRQVSLRKGSNLFLSLATHDINLPSNCGGGGECGKCRVQIETAGLPSANAIERGLVPKRLLEQGFRLACQHRLENSVTLQLPIEYYT